MHQTLALLCTDARNVLNRSTMSCYVDATHYTEEVKQAEGHSPATVPQSLS